MYFLKDLIIHSFIQFIWETLHKKGWGSEKEERKFQADSAMSVECNSGLDSTSMRSRPKPKSRVRP